MDPVVMTALVVITVRLCDPWVLQDLFGGDPIARLNNQHLLQQVFAVIRSVPR